MEQMSIDTLRARLQAGEPVRLVDVRQPEEHADFNIGGTLLPLGEILSMQTEVLDEYREEEIICYCRSGQRSMQAALMLQSMGFPNVKNLTGGMLAWEAAYGRG